MKQSICGFFGLLRFGIAESRNDEKVKDYFGDSLNCLAMTEKAGIASCESEIHPRNDEIDYVVDFTRTHLR